MMRSGHATTHGARLALAALIVVASGCASLGGPIERPSEAERACIEAFARIDEAVVRDTASDGGARRIDGFPHLRVDRLLASYRDELRDAAAERFWVDRLLALDRSARSAELANLSSATAAELERSLVPIAPGERPSDVVTRCGRLLREADDRLPQRMAALRSRAVVPDDYSLGLRALGLYPISSIGFAAGIRGWQRETATQFAAPIDERRVRGLLWSYSPTSSSNPPGAQEVLPRERVAAILARAADNPLRVPLPSGADLEALVRSFAPVYEVDTVTDDDRIGAPIFSERGAPRIDTRRPTIYARTAATRVGDRALLQIVYTAWFPARTKTGMLDLLGGPLDGLVWRVTLAPDGAPLVFDTIHPCGCYHLFFPRPGITARPSPRLLEEFVFVPQQIGEMPAGARVVLRLATRTHYLEHVGFEKAIDRAVSYELAHDDDLRSVSVAFGRRRSLFASNGIVAGTERGERFLFWPMGIESAGAMRQWGRHATAFVGRRHFDDPRLLDERFALPAFDAR